MSWLLWGVVLLTALGFVSRRPGNARRRFERQQAPRPRWETEDRNHG